MKSGNHFINNLRRYVLIILFVIASIVWYGILFETAHNKNLTLAFLDIGQGDSIFIEAPNGNQILIDGGSGAQILRKLGEVMPIYDREIDVVVATHPDKDHIGGLVDVINRFDVKYFIEPGIIGDTKIFKALEDSVEAHHIKKIIAQRDMKIDLGGGAVLTVLYPDRDVTHIKNTNDGSIVARLTYGDTSAILTGDAPQFVEVRIVSLDGRNLKSNILKLGHHGSRTSTSALFLGAIQPDYAIISAGLNNSYGHPHKEVMDLINKFKILPIGTYEKGTIVFKSDGEIIERQ